METRGWVGALLPGVDFPGLEGVLEVRHVDSFAGELDALELEAGALFVGRVAAQLDLAADAEDAMPRELVDWLMAQEFGDGSVIARVAGGRGYSAIGADLAGGDGEDHVAEGLVTLFVLAESIAQQGSLAAGDGELV